MENLIENDSEDEIASGQNDQTNNYDSKWKINYEKELEFWNKSVLKELIYKPDICPKCKQSTYKIYKKQNPDIINPYYIKCTKQNCQKRENIRKYSVLKIAKLIPASIIYDIILLFIVEKKNGKEIESKLKDNYIIVPNYITILNIIDSMRKIIAEYLKYSYKISQIGGDPDTERTVVIDETFITHYDGKEKYGFVELLMIPIKI